MRVCPASWPWPSLLSYYPCMEPVSISCVSLQLGHVLLYFPIICAWSRGRFLVFPCTWVICFFTFLSSAHGADADFLCFLAPRPRAPLLSYETCMEPCSECLLHVAVSLIWVHLGRGASFCKILALVSFAIWPGWRLAC